MEAGGHRMDAATNGLEPLGKWYAPTQTYGRKIVPDGMGW